MLHVNYQKYIIGYSKENLIQELIYYKQKREFKSIIRIYFFKSVLFISLYHISFYHIHVRSRLCIYLPSLCPYSYDHNLNTLLLLGTEYYHFQDLLKLYIFSYQLSDILYSLHICIFIKFLSALFRKFVCRVRILRFVVSI